MVSFIRCFDELWVFRGFSEFQKPKSLKKSQNLSKTSKLVENLKILTKLPKLCCFWSKTPKIDKIQCLTSLKHRNHSFQPILSFFFQKSNIFKQSQKWRRHSTSHPYGSIGLRKTTMYSKYSWSSSAGKYLSFATKLYNFWIVFATDCCWSIVSPQQV